MIAKKDASSRYGKSKILERWKCFRNLGMKILHFISQVEKMSE
jgi:hypothetical protein